MNRYAELELDRLVTDLYLIGAAVVRWDLMYHWYKATRLSKSAFRDIRDRWVTVCEEHGYLGQDIPKVKLLMGPNCLTLVREAFRDEDWADLNEKI